MGAIAVVASLLVPMLLQGTFETFLVAMAAPLIVALLVALRWPRVGTVLLGALSLALLASTAPYMLQPLTHPEAVVDFVSMVVFVVGTIVAAAATVPAFRAEARVHVASRAPRTIAVAGAAIILAATVVAITTSTRVENEPAQAGDIQLITELNEFTPAGLSAEAGTISVHVANRDQTRHTFTIDELGVDLSIAPGSSQRVTFDAGPGTYRFYCRPHAPDMEGTITVG